MATKIYCQTKNFRSENDDTDNFSRICDGGKPSIYNANL